MTAEDGGKTASPSSPPEDPNEVVHVIRMLEYIGPRYWVETTLAASTITGTNKIGKGMYIRSTILGPVKDPFSRSFTRPDYTNPEETFTPPEEAKKRGESEGEGETTVVYVIAIPLKVVKGKTEFGYTYGPFESLDDGLKFTPVHPNSLLLEVGVEANGDPKTEKVLYSWNEQSGQWESFRQ